MTLSAVSVAAVPVEPTREQAQRWAVEELAKREYAQQRPGVIERLIDWLLGRLGEVGGPVGQGTGTTFAVLVGVIVVLVVVALLVAGRVLRRARTTEPGAIFDGVTGPAAGHRAAADAAARAGDWRLAVVERFRAVVRELEERAVLAPAPGRTADEAAAEAARWLPELAGPLRSAAELFDDVRYGDRPADGSADAALQRLDEQVRGARISAGTDPSAGEDLGAGPEHATAAAPRAPS